MRKLTLGVFLAAAMAAAMAAAAEQPAADSAASIRLYVFDCGTLSLEDVSAFGIGNDETPVRQLFVPCYLLEHRDADRVRRLLFDAGLPAGIAGQGPVSPEPGLVMHYARSLQDQLAELNLAPADIDYLAFSHLHFDHVGSANLFTEAVHLIQHEEYQAGFIAGHSEFYEQDLFAALADSPRQVLHGDHDVFGDDSVRLVSAPGHTPGHQVLLVRLQDPGPVVLSGDLYHFRESRRLRRVPLFNSDAQQTLASMDKVEALLQAENATLWIQHDQALADTLNKAPAYYQ
ncbi:MAG: N-acyl homoserine lactonase family protein [Pseudomonadales bacterium]